jgi:hypothetical protein
VKNSGETWYNVQIRIQIKRRPVLLLAKQSTDKKLLTWNGSKAMYFQISVEKETLLPQWPAQMLLATSFHQLLYTKGKNIVQNVQKIIQIVREP